jgi:hypothetical protein
MNLTRMRPHYKDQSVDAGGNDSCLLKELYASHQYMHSADKIQLFNVIMGDTYKSGRLVTDDEPTVFS